MGLAQRCRKETLVSDYKTGPRFTPHEAPKLEGEELSREKATLASERSERCRGAPLDSEEPKSITGAEG